MPRFKIHIQYDGALFHGWQYQKNDQSIQGELEKVFLLLNHGETINVVGSGRTDSGVHALHQVAHFDWNTDKDTCEIRDGLNGNLPNEIRISDCEVVPNDFHARFSAKSRQYKYQCRTNDFIFDRNIVWQTGHLDFKWLNESAELVQGEHDFTSFSKANPEINNRICYVTKSEWTQEGDIVNYRIKANRFLHHMVRYLVGTMVEVSRQNMTLYEFKNLLKIPREDVHIFKAPAQGLFLERVEYSSADTF